MIFSWVDLTFLDYVMQRNLFDEENERDDDEEDMWEEEEEYNELDLL